MMTKIILQPPLRTVVDVDLEKHRRLAQGLTFEGRRYQIRETDRPFITSTLVAAKVAIDTGSIEGNLRWIDPKQEFAWIATDNSLVPMDAQTAFQLARAALSVMMELSLAARKIKDRICRGEEIRQVGLDELWNSTANSR